MLPRAPRCPQMPIGLPCPLPLSSADSAGMSSRNGALAVLLRRAQWALDEAAHDLPAGRCTVEDREALAVLLEELAAALRREETMPSVVDAE